jgi:pimeloyl-ACP methyl ester carboxylesterase
LAPTAGPDAVVELTGPWRHRYVAANGARFHVVEATSERRPPGAEHGTVVLLLHGFPEFWWAWREQLPTLAAHGHRAVAMDLRGYGGSDKPPRGYDPLTLADDVAGVTKALGARRVVLVGQGWGGYVAWTTAVRHRRLVAGLCAVAAPHPSAMLSELGPARGLTALSHVLTMQLPFLPERRLSRPGSSYVDEHLRAWSSPSSGFPTPDVSSTYADALALWPAAHCALEYHRWLVRSRVRADGRRFAALMSSPVTAPVLEIRGADDPVLPASADSRAHVQDEHGVSVLRDTGHFPHEEDPAAFDAVVLPWLEELRRSHRC